MPGGKLEEPEETPFNSFVKLAEKEHESITELCNTAAMLSHAVVEDRNARTRTGSLNGGGFTRGGGLERAIKFSSSYFYMYDLKDGVDDLSRIHGEMKELLHSMPCEDLEILKGDCKVVGHNSGNVMKPLAPMNNGFGLADVDISTKRKMENHLGLGERVIRTCLEKRDANGVGVRECRLVALSALQASIAELKKWKQDHESSP